jgi:hypothetical protein
VNDIFERKPVPLWRLVSYGLLAAVGVALIGYLSHDRSWLIAIPAIICGVVVTGFGFFLNVARTSSNPRRFEYARWLIAVGLALRMALTLWDILHQK